MFFSITTYNFLTTGSKLYSKCLPSLLAFTSFLYLQSYRNHAKEISWIGETRFGSPEKDCYFLKIPKSQNELVREYKRGKLVSYFLNNAKHVYMD